MKYFLALALTILLIITEHQYFNNENQSDFKKWAIKHNKYFSDNEKMYRMEIYYSNKKMIEEHNLIKDTSYQMGENQFMTFTHQGFISLMLQEKVEYPEVKENVNIPIIQQQKLSAVDWRNYVKQPNKQSIAVQEQEIAFIQKKFGLYQIKWNSDRRRISIMMFTNHIVKEIRDIGSLTTTKDIIMSNQIKTNYHYFQIVIQQQLMLIQVNGNFINLIYSQITIDFNRQLFFGSRL